MKYDSKARTTAEKNAIVAIEAGLSYGEYHNQVAANGRIPLPGRIFRRLEDEHESQMAQ